MPLKERRRLLFKEESKKDVSSSKASVAGLRKGSGNGPSVPVPHPCDGPRGVSCASNTLSSVQRKKVESMGKDVQPTTCLKSEVLDEALTNRKRDALLRAGVSESRRKASEQAWMKNCLLYTSPSPRDRQKSRMPSSA